MLSKTIRLQTKRLYLEASKRSDIPAVFAATRSPGFNDGMLWDPPLKIQDMDAPFERSEKAWESGAGYTFSSYLITDNQMVGRISIRRETKPDCWNIGFFTLPEHQGNGYMSESVTAILLLGFDQLQAKAITACYATWNKASERVLQKNRFSFVKYIEKGFQKNGKWVPENLVQIDQVTWQESRNF